MRMDMNRKWILTGSIGMAAIALASLGFGRAHSRARPGTQLAVAEALDNIVQPRFQDDRVGVFGLSRIYIPGDLSGHGTIASFQAKDPTEAKLFRDVANAGRDYLIGFLYTAHPVGRFRSEFAQGKVIHRALTVTEKNPMAPVKPLLRVLVARHPIPTATLEAPGPSGGSASGGTDFGSSPVTQSAAPRRPAAVVAPERVSRIEFPDPKVFPSEDYAELQKIAVEAVPKMKQGRPVDLKYKDWMVALRPVRAEKASCIACHTGAKINDTLGVMVYVISNKRNDFGAPAAKVSAF